jgi:hypothetical protein
MEVKIVAKAITKTQLNSCLGRIAAYFSNVLLNINLDGVVPGSLNVVKHYGECSFEFVHLGKSFQVFKVFIFYHPQVKTL